MRTSSPAASTTAAVLYAPGRIAKDRLTIEQRSLRPLGDGEILVEVRACGVCRTDLNIVEGDLPPHHPSIVPGHQIVGVVTAAAPGVTLAVGTRVGISWLGGTDGTCRFCREGRENLCDHPVYTGYDVDGGYAHAVVARADFAHPLSDALDDLHAAPLLCAGIIGFRALRVAGVQPGEHVGLYGFGSSAHLALPILKSWGCSVSVVTRGADHRATAEHLGADWVGKESARPPQPLDRAVTFAPAGAVVVSALGALRKGGVVAINAIHLDCIPRFDYDSLLWGGARNSQRDQHDARRCARFSRACRRAETHAGGARISARAGQRGPARRRRGSDRRLRGYYHLLIARAMTSAGTVALEREERRRHEYAVA